MKILVTGSHGFIGSHLIPALKKKGHTIRSYDIKDKQNILNIKQLSKAIEWSNVAYHLASLTDVQESFKKQNNYIETIFTGTFNVIKLCYKYQKKFIYTSTAAIYDPYSSPYALNKYLVEQLLKEIKLFPIVVLRLFNVYGKGMNKTTMLYRFQNEVPITIYGDGKQTRDFIYIEDAVNILTLALDKKWNGFIGDVGTGKGLTVFSIAKLFNKLIVYKEKRQEVNRSVANITKLRKLYKTPFYQLKDYICNTPGSEIFY